jgi:hypothetical protein
MRRLRPRICEALAGRYATPFSASGIRTTMMIALKMMALVTADAGECSCMRFSAASPGRRP